MLICNEISLISAFGLYNNVVTDVFYNVPLECSVKTLPDHSCCIYISPNAIREKGRTTCHKHINQPTANSLILLSKRLNAFLIEGDECEDSEGDKAAFISFIKDVRSIHRSNTQNLNKPLWFVAIMAIIFECALNTGNNQIMRYLYLTLNFVLFKRECSCMLKQWTNRRCGNCGEYLTLDTSSSESIYNGKDILFGLLLKCGRLYETLPRELILDIFNTCLCLHYPGVEYKTEQKKNTKL